MQFSKSKATAIIITIIMMTSITVMTATAQDQFEGETAHGGQPVPGYEGPTTVPAGQTPDFTIASSAFLSVSPNPIGVGQELLVNVWTTFPSGEGKYQVGYKVTITKPDTTTEVVNLKSYVADGTSWFTYVPQQVGTWKFEFDFAGEWFPAGFYRDGQYSTTRTGFFANAIFNPSVYVSPASATPVFITVQSDFAVSWQSPLPTDYWTRPIQPNNREWNVIAGNYPWEERLAGAISWNDGYYGPFIDAPNTPHILWKEQGAIAGIIGGETGTYSTLSSPGTPSVIFMGRCYQTVTKVKQTLINGTYRQQPVSVATCYDLRTGAVYYDIPVSDGGITPTHISYFRNVDTAVPGAGEAASFGIELHTVSGGRLYKINPLTGAVTVNVSLPSDLGTAEFFYRNGYYLSYRSFRNNQQTDPTSNITVTKSTTGFLVNWSAQGSSTNFTSRIVSNITVTIQNSLRTLYQTGSYGALGAYDPETGITVNQNRFIYGGYYGSSLEVTSLVTGQALWNWTSDRNVMESAYRPTNAWCRHGRYIAEMEKGYLKAWNLQNGAVLWESHIPDLPWGEFYLYDEAAFEDMVYATGYTGVWAFNETNGNIVWHFADEAVPFETPYMTGNFSMSSYAVQNIRVADGKIYVANSEHTPTQPATRGWGLICLDAHTGEKLWKIMGTAMGVGPAADGYLVTASNYDGYRYVLGKGPSKITVNAPTTAVANGSIVMIQGSVMDMSPASPNTPAVADESMDTWMDYLHLQMPVDGIFHNETIKGVDVTLVAVDSNNNPITIGTATTDTSGNFAFAWTPTFLSTYRITAIFSGSDSYGSSTATTSMVVGASQSTGTGGNTNGSGGQPGPDYTWTIIGSAIAIIIVVILVGVLIMMRRH